MAEKIEKYKINEFLDKLTVKEYKFAMRKIPAILKISTNTFHNYRHIKLKEKQDIPYEKVKKMEIIFSTKVGGLENRKISGKSLSDMIKELK